MLDNTSEPRMTFEEDTEPSPKQHYASQLEPKDCFLFLGKGGYRALGVRMSCADSGGHVSVFDLSNSAVVNLADDLPVQLISCCVKWKRL